MHQILALTGDRLARAIEITRRLKATEQGARPDSVNTGPRIPASVLHQTAADPYFQDVFAFQLVAVV